VKIPFIIKIIKDKNQIKNHQIREINKESSKTKIFVIPTNEELVIAQDTFNLVK
jgi:acetate kinase